MIWLLGGVIIAATLALIGLFFGLAALYDWWRARYQAKRRHVLHTTAADERLVAAERQSMSKLRELPAPGLSIYTDRNVWLPRTPQAGDLSPFTTGPVVWTPARSPITEAELEEFKVRWEAAQGWLPAEAPPVVADITTAPPRHDDSPRRVPPGCTTCGSYSHWTDGHDTATSKLHAEPVTTTGLAVPDSTFVRALLALPLSRVYEAFEGARQ